MGTSATEVERLIQAARLHLAQGELHEAAGRATEAIRLDGKASAAYLVRAEAHRRLKRPERALADLAVAIRLDPQQPSPYVIRAEILKRRCLLDQAIADATSALMLDPRNAAAYAIRAQCRYAIGDQEGAREDVQEMLLIDPTRPVPDLRAGSVSDPSPSTADDDERFWKQAGGREDERAQFADGKPVDKTYRSRPAVSNEDAPEVLGAASGYRPEVLATPIPRTRSHRGRPGRHAPWALIILGGAALFGGGLLWATRDQPKEVVPEKVEAVGPAVVDAGPTYRPEPVAAPAVSDRPPATLTPVPSPVKEPSVPTRLGGESPSLSGGRPTEYTGLGAWQTTEPVEVMNWVSQDGVLTHAAQGPALMTKERFDNFELHLEFLLPPKCNSGVFLRGRYEVQLIDPDLILPSGRRLAPQENNGAIYGLIPPRRVVYSGPNKWNTLDVRMVGRNVSVRLNDVLVVDNKRVDRPTVGALDSNEGEPGPIVLQGQAVTGCKFRNISITPLPATEIKTSRNGTLEGHTGVILGVAFSPDGKWVASSGDTTVRLWKVGDLSDDAHIVLAAQEPQTERFIAVAFCPDGKTLAASGFDGRIALWDMTASPPRRLRVLHGHGDPVVALAFSPDGQSLVTGGRNDGLVCFWDMAHPAATPRSTIPPERNGVWSLAYSPDGKTLAEGVSFPRPGKPIDSAQPGEIWLWDVSRRPYVKRAVVKEARKVPRSLVYSPDGSRLAFGDGDVASIIDVGTGKWLGTFEGHTSFVVSVAFTPDGKRAISGGYDKAVRLWDATTMEQVHVFDGHEGYVEQVAVSPDGRLAASCGHDKTVRLWRLPTTASDGKSR